MFTGCGTAMVTPFRRDLSLDEDVLRRLVRRQVANGINFLVPLGTTGENPTLKHKERLRVVEITLEEAKGRVPVLAGAGGNDTAEVIHAARELAAMEVSGILSVTPYYNKPTQEGIYQHYKAIAAAITLPIVIYNIQGRTGVNVETPTLLRLAEIDNIVGVKEASGSITQIASVCAQAPEGFLVLSGDDAVTVPVMALGGHGVISVLSNEIPAELVRLVQSCEKGDFAAARSLQRTYHPLMEANFLESNPIPVKAALAAMGLLEPVWRLPLCAPKAETLARIRAVLDSLGLLGGRHAAGAN